MVFEGPSATVSGAEGTGTIARRLVSNLFAPGAEASAPTLVVVSGADRRGVLRLEERDRPYVVGPGRDLRSAPGVEEISREHAAFTRRWDGVFVADLGSKNGVRVSGVLAGKQRLRDGDRDPRSGRSRFACSIPRIATCAISRPAPSPPAPRNRRRRRRRRPSLHPAVAGALAAEQDRSVSFTERTGFHSLPSGARVATYVAAIVLAAIAAVAVTLAFG